MNAKVQSINPATLDTIEEFTAQSREQANQVVEQAHQAFLSWRDQSIEARADIVRCIGDQLGQAKDELAKMMSQQMGKTIAESEAEVDLCVQICSYTADQGPKLLASESKDLESGRGEIVYQPLGVILALQPWNFPLYQVVRYSIPNIMAGNTTVLKHSDVVWGTARKIQELYQAAGLPDHVFSVIYVDNETADALVEHDKVKGVTLTGSAKAGKIVAEKAGAHLKKTLLELGGSDPYIVLDDAPIKDIIKDCVIGRINNAGQTCVAAKRFIVLESKYEEFKSAFVEAMSKVKYGDPFDRENQMGPMSSKSARDGLHEQVQASVKHGAKCLTGGKVPEQTGFYYPATVLENVKPGCPAYDEELFGPVAVLFKVKDEKEALAIANDHNYGLGGGIFSADEQRAKKLALQLETGMVNINGYGLAQPDMPFGGVKDSGYGREHAGFGMRTFVYVKSIVSPK